MKKEDLPNILPVFPLSNFIIFPRTTVPLNIFEPRYIEMIDQSMKTNISIEAPKKPNSSPTTQNIKSVHCSGKKRN